MQKEFCGRGQTSVIVEVLRQLDCRRVFLVTGKRSFESCGARAAIEPLLDGFDVTRFNDYSANPTFEQALNGSGQYAAHNCDVIIAVGGGSAMDIAKTINAFQAFPGQETEVTRGKQAIDRVLAPLIAIPTTAGTGSEATHFSAIYMDGRKYSLAAPSLLPTVSILDARFTDGLPPYITACTGIDALCQATESFWASAATGESRGFARQAIALLVEHLVPAVKEDVVSARDQLLEAANFAGKAINISKTTAPHALSYAITSIYGVPHGHAVALTLGNFFPLHDAVTEDSLQGGYDRDTFSRLMSELYSLFSVENGQAARVFWYDLMTQCGLETRPSAMGIASDAAIAEIFAAVNLERLGNHPVKLSVDQLKGVFINV
jgi:alcohol dehydrogenase class IV